MVELNDFLRQTQFNGQRLDQGGTFDPSRGGFTVSNAPLVFARLLQQLSQPGGPLSSLESSRVLAGQVSGITTAGESERRATGSRLASAGVNEAQGAAILSGVDTGIQRAISQARSTERQRLNDAQQEALTGFANVVAQSESTQKERAEQLRQFEIALSETRKQQRFNRIVSIASLGVSAFGAGLFNGLGSRISGLFGGSAPAGSPQPNGGLDFPTSARNSFLGGGVDLPARIANPAGSPFGRLSL
jgi:hypothetical protein